MAVHGTIINVVTTALAFTMLTGGVSSCVAVFVYFAPLPYNVFLLLAVWRTAERDKGLLSWAARPLAVLWLTAAVLL